MKYTFDISFTITASNGEDLLLKLLCVNGTFADMSAGVLDCGVAVDVGQKSEAEAVLVV